MTGPPDSDQLANRIIAQLDRWGTDLRDYYAVPLALIGVGIRHPHQRVLRTSGCVPNLLLARLLRDLADQLEQEAGRG